MAPRPPKIQLLRTVAALMAPVVAALVVLMAVGALAPIPGLLAAGACGAVITIMVWRHLRDLAALRALSEGLARRPLEEVPAVGDGSLVAGIDGALRRQRRAWLKRGEETRTQLAADETIIDSLPDPMITLDAQMRVVRANAAAATLLGRTLVGRDLAAALRHPDIIDAVQRTLGDGVGREAEFTLPGAVERVFDARTRMLGDKPADGAAVLLTLHDLTEVKRADRMRADFVANVSHELRTPLSSVIGFVETLRGPAADDGAARERFLAIMQEQAARMARLIDDLLSLSRIELSEHARPTDRADLAAITRRAADSLELRAAAREMPITIDFQAAEAPVAGDTDQLEQVVQNLIDNALKYGAAESPVEVTVGAAERGPAPLDRPDPDAGVFFVAVRNAGDGIAPEHLPRLTERFYRIDPARSRELGGTGLGLAIAKHIVNRHRGALAIESAPGRGATFTLYLPAAPTARQAPRAAAG